MNNQIKIASGITTADTIDAFLTEAVKNGATHTHLLKAGGKRATVDTIEPRASHLELLDGATLTVGTKAPGLPFEPLEISEANPTAPLVITKVDPTKPAALKPKPSQTKEVPPLNKESYRGSGYVSYIDSLLLDVDGKGKDEKGFLRSKFTVTDAVRATLIRFPAKNPGSVKRVVKVRPRHLERAKTVEQFDDKNNRAPRWAWSGPGSGTGFMRRVDELIVQGKHTAREIAEITAKEFGRDVDSALLMIKVRPNFLKRKRNIKANPKPVPKKESRREITKRKNMELLGRKIANQLGL